MRPRYDFSSRHTGRATKSPKMRRQRPKYPDLSNQVVSESDIVLEVLDARFLEDTRNHAVEDDIIKKDKKIIYVANKADLSREKTADLYPLLFVSCKERQGIKKLRDKIKELAKKIAKDKVIVGVIGYPNTGKSSLINILIGKKSAPVGSEAGFTKGMQKVKLSQGIVLLDSPGVISAKEYSSNESSKIAQHTKVGARSYTQVKDPELVIASLIKEFPGVLEEHYNIQSNGDSEILIEELGQKLHFFKKGGVVDEDKTARQILKDWQQGKIKI